MNIKKIKNKPLRIALEVLSSLKLSIACLFLLGVLVFVATISQKDTGIYFVKKTYFEPWIVFYKTKKGLSFPILPGGLLIGFILVFNLITAHFLRFKWNIKKSGIWLTHVGLIVLIIGSGLTSANAVESQMRIREGDTSYFSESLHDVELAVVFKQDAKSDKLVSFPKSVFRKGGILQHPELPFSIHINEYYPNSDINDAPTQFVQSVTKGLGQQMGVWPVPMIKRENFRNQPSLIVEVVENETLEKQRTETFLLSNWFKKFQVITFNGIEYGLMVRPKRYYYPFKMTLNKFTHEKYAGTSIPKNFASEVTVNSPKQKESYNFLIYMNHPFRYEGNTFYQASFGENDTMSVLQVVKNPAWLFPYLSSIMIGVGLIIQFMIHLTGFLRKTRLK